ncbi:MAG: ABC transporter substrate-binding protein [Betaproteobacteria bacterium]|nr:ABC transporter substrate-binding protein [Betaproteobacteria bacterium]
MDRRDAGVALVALGIAPLASWAQPARKAHRIGILSQAIPLPERFALLSAALRELGYEEGRNIAFDYRFAEGREDRLPGLAADLVAKKVDLIVAFLNPEILAAKRATSTIPIVMVYAMAPVETGLVASLARPGGNLTGTTLQGPETAGKILEVLRDAVPGVARITILGEPEFPGMKLYIRATERAAEAMGIRLTLLPVRTLEEVETAFTVIARTRPDALYVVPTGAIVLHRARVIEFAARQRLPAVYTAKLLVIEGGLISYSQDQAALVRRTAAIIDRILKGAKPAELPVEQPTKFDLVVNLKTAKALGISIPKSVLVRADEVIQ